MEQHDLASTTGWMQVLYKFLVSHSQTIVWRDQCPTPHAELHKVFAKSSPEADDDVCGVKFSEAHIVLVL